MTKSDEELFFVDDDLAQEGNDQISDELEKSLEIEGVNDSQDKSIFVSQREIISIIFSKKTLYHVLVLFILLSFFGIISYTKSDLASSLILIFDLFYNERFEESIHSFSVFPQVEVLEEQVITSRAPKLLSGAMPLNVIGTGTEFYSLREFVPGDSLRSVNWKALAKKGKMMVNETVREDVMDVILLLDAREVSAVGGGRDTPLEMSCRAAATYAKQLLDERNNVALMVYGESIERVDLDRGEHHLFKILTALSSAKPQGNLKLQIVLKDLLPHLPSGSPIILFSSLDDDHTISEAFTSTISRGFTITTISPSSLDFEERMKRIPLEPLLIAKIERDNMISELRSFGLQVGDWKYGDNVNTALQEI